MKKSPEWMPVFVVRPATSEVTAREGKYSTKSKLRRGRDYWQRIGTAHSRDDGSIVVQLTAVPVDGRLVIRPPQSGERIDPTLYLK